MTIAPKYEQFKSERCEAASQPHTDGSSSSRTLSITCRWAVLVVTQGSNKNLYDHSDLTNVSLWDGTTMKNFRALTYRPLVGCCSKRVPLSKQIDTQPSIDLFSIHTATQRDREWPRAIWSDSAVDNSFRSVSIQQQLSQAAALMKQYCLPFKASALSRANRPSATGLTIVVVKMYLTMIMWCLI